MGFTLVFYNWIHNRRLVLKKNNIYGHEIH